MSRYAQSMTEVVTAYGGNVERFRGDEVMAVFGVPVVHEDDALRAVRAGMEMQRRLAELNVELLEAWGVEPPAGSASTAVRSSRATPARANLRHRRRRQPRQASGAGSRTGRDLIGTAT